MPVYLLDPCTVIQDQQSLFWGALIEELFNAVRWELP